MNKNLWLVNKTGYFEFGEKDGLKAKKHYYIVNNRNDIYNICKKLDKRALNFTAEKMLLVPSENITVYTDYISIKGYGFIKNNKRNRIYITDSDVVCVFINVFERTA